MNTSVLSPIVHLMNNSHRMRFDAYAYVARQKRMRMRNFTQTYPYFGVNWRKAMRLASTRASDADEVVCVKSSTSSNFLRMSLRKSSNLTDMTRASYSATPLLRSLVHRPQGIIHTYMYWLAVITYNRFLRWWIYNRFLTVGLRKTSRKLLAVRGRRIKKLEFLT